MSKETYYFSHDYNARSDPKIKRLIAKHGMQGYGIYWGIVEDLYNNANALPTQYDVIAFDMRCEEKVVKSIVNDFGLFAFNGESFGSPSVGRRLDERNKRSASARESANARWEKEKERSERNANAVQPHSGRNAKGKERKGKEIKEKESKMSPPTLNDMETYFNEKGYSKQHAKKVFDYYTEGGWKDSEGRPVRSWKQKCISVWFKDEGKIQEEKKRPFMNFEPQ
jgi:uncharacterized protein YdaU (DUF1376 family)